MGTFGPSYTLKTLEDFRGAVRTPCASAPSACGRSITIGSPTSTPLNASVHPSTPRRRPPIHADGLRPPPPSEGSPRPKASTPDQSPLPMISLQTSGRRQMPSPRCSRSCLATTETRLSTSSPSLQPWPENHGNTWPEKCGSVWVRKVRKCVAVYSGSPEVGASSAMATTSSI
jgi:hypothetical protein